MTATRGLRDAWHDLGWAWPTAVAVACPWLLAAAALVGSPAQARTLAAADSLPRLVALGLLLPLCYFGLAARAGATNQELLRCEWARHGEDRRLYALGRLCLAWLVALAAALLITAGVLAVEWASSATGGVSLSDGPALLRLVLATGLAAIAYVPLLAVAQLLGGHWGRSLVLVLDWLLGSGVGLTALPWPRSHLRSLIGGASVSDLGSTGSAVALLIVAALATALYARRVPR